MRRISNEIQKILGSLLAVAMSFSMLTGCGKTTTSDEQASNDTEVTESTTDTEDTADTDTTADDATDSESTDDNETGANQLMKDLTGTYHIELRYGSDLTALGQYDAGDYAYWLGSGISTDYDLTMIENCIQLFCTENLSGQE